MRHSLRGVCLAVRLLALLLASVACLGGCGYYRSDVIPDYGTFLTGFTKSNPVELPVEEKPSPIEGFVPLFDMYFDYGQGFVGDVTLAVKNDVAYYLRTDGERRETSFDLFENVVYFEKVVTKRGALWGVYDLSGKEILPIAYDRVEVVGKTVLAVRGNVASVLSDFGSADKLFESEVYLADERHVYCDEIFYDLQFTEKQAQGCTYLDIPSENKVRVSDSRTGLVGYADEEGNLVIEPQFLDGGQFNEGTAVVLEKDRTVSVIDAHGKRLYHAAKGDKLGLQNDGVRCFMRHNMYGVLDAGFQEVVSPFLLFVKNERAYGNYLIVRREAKETFFSLQTKNYVSLAFDEIEPLADLFLCKNDVSYSLLDRNLRTLTSGCDSIAYDGMVLTVRKDGKVAYYTKKVQGCVWNDGR